MPHIIRTGIAAMARILSIAINNENPLCTANGSREKSDCERSSRHLNSGDMQSGQMTKKYSRTDREQVKGTTN